MDPTIDLAAVRADTPGCDDVVHFNNAGSSLPVGAVVDAVVGYLRQEQRAGGYETEDAEAERLDRLYDATAELLGCRADEVAFTPNASEAWWRAFQSIPLGPNSRVLVGKSTFQANAYGLMQAAERGVTVEMVPHDDHGLIDLEALDRMLAGGADVVCLTQISMSNGAIQPAADVGALAAAAGSIYLLDACQAAGQLPLDVDTLGCDFLLYTGRKYMRAPRGTGILYARQSVLDRLGPTPFVDGRSAVWNELHSYEFAPGARRFEMGEQNFAGKLGLAVATDYLLGIGVEAVAERVQPLAELLRAGLGAIGGVRIQDQGIERCGIVTYTVDGHAPSEVKAFLTQRGINVSAPGRTNAQFDFEERGIDAVVRAGVHYFNTEDEVERLVAETATLT